MTKPTYKKGVEFFENILDSMTIDSYSIIPNSEWLIYKINFTNTSKKVLFIDEYMLTVEILQEVLHLLSYGDCIYQMGNWQNSTSKADELANDNGILICNPTNVKKCIYS